MSTHEHEPPAVVHVPPGGGHSWWVYGDKDIIKVASEETGGALMFMETVIPPHAGPPLHIHHRENEAFYVLDGDIKVVDNDREFQVTTGGSSTCRKRASTGSRTCATYPARSCSSSSPAVSRDTSGRWASR